MEPTSQAAQPGGRELLPSEFFLFCFVSMPPGQAPGLWMAAWEGPSTYHHGGTSGKKVRRTRADGDDFIGREGGTLDDLLHAACRSVYRSAPSQLQAPCMYIVCRVGYPTYAATTREGRTLKWRGGRRRGSVNFDESFQECCFPSSAPYLVSPWSPLSRRMPSIPASPALKEASQQGTP